MGGIHEAYFANKEDVKDVTITEEQVSAITMEEGKKFTKFQFARNTGSMSSTYTKDPTTGVNYVTTELNLVFNRMETSKRVAIAALAQNDLVAIVKDANGKYWYLGFNEPVTATTGDGVTGTARGDRNGYSVTLQDNSHEMPYEVNPAIVAALVA
jgi:hypothetical protein